MAAKNTPETTQKPTEIAKQAPASPAKRTLRASKRQVKGKVAAGKATLRDKKGRADKEGEPTGGKKILKSLWLKEVVLGVVNLGLVLSTIFLLGKLPTRASEFNKVRNASISESTKSEVEVAGLEIAASKEKADKLNSLFPDEAGLIGFVREIDRLKEEGLVTRFAFAREKAVKDKTGHFGIPVIIEFRGGWLEIGQGLTRLNETPYLLRAVTIEANRSGEDGNLIIFKYGGFLYVDETLAKN